MIRNSGLYFGTHRAAKLVALTVSAAFLSTAGIGVATIVHPQLGQPAWAKKKPPKAESTTEPAVQHFDEGMKKVKAGDIDGGIDAFLQAIYFARNNYHPPAYFMLGNCYKLKHEDGKALEALQKHVVQTVGPAPDAHCDIAEILMRNGREREAEAELNRALVEFKGPGPRAHNLMGKVLEKKGDIKNAAWHFEQALGDQPWVYTEAWMNFAENMMKQKEWSEALSQFFAILARGKTLLGVDYQKVFLNIGSCQLNKGDHAGAINSWHEVLKLNQDHPEAHLYLAMILDKEQHITSAIKEYRQFLRVAPTDTKAQLVKSRMTELEQKITPTGPEVAPAKPSPYMRQAQEEDAAKRQAYEAEMRRRMENLETVGAPQQKGDSGF